METILESEVHCKISDKDKVEEVLSALPLKVKSLLSRHRDALIGSKKKKRRHVRHAYFVQ